jgi:anti-sigma regulatory factor (Ser/Thr protein kinase)
VCRVARWVFACTPSDVSRARRVVRAAMAEWHVPQGDPSRQVWEDLELVVGEVAGNAARFCQGHFAITLQVHHDHARLEVVDDGAGTEALQLSAPTRLPPEAESGRGLVIVSAIASRWGAERVTTSVSGGSGTRVWAELAFPDVSPHFTPGCERITV